MNIALCFFGITRSLHHTIGSVESCVRQPCRELAQTETFCHFFRLEAIHNPRSGEFGALPQDEHTLLTPSWLQLEVPDAPLAALPLQQICAYGDSWGDEFKSLQNLLHQLHSLKRVTKAALAAGHDFVVFARPDLLYHDAIRRPLRQVMQSARDNEVCLPDWQHWEGGFNDRFALCKGRRAIAAYGQRLDDVLDYCQRHQGPLHAEKLLRHALEQRGIPVSTMTTRASRMRFDGTLKNEVFWPNCGRLGRMRRLVLAYRPPRRDSGARLAGPTMRT